MAVRLSEPDPELRASYLAALRELSAEGDAAFFELVVPASPGVAAREFTLRTLADEGVFPEFCALTRSLSDSQAPRPRGWVPGTYRWMVDDHDEVVGRISLRHSLTPWLLETGGHVGYAVRPSARRRGHATAALGLMLPVAAAHGIDTVLVTCDEDNLGSRAVIEANGGVLEDVRSTKLRFWVPTR